MDWYNKYCENRHELNKDNHNRLAKVDGQEATKLHPYSKN